MPHVLRFNNRTGWSARLLHACRGSHGQRRVPGVTIRRDLSSLKAAMEAPERLAAR